MSRFPSLARVLSCTPKHGVGILLGESRLIAARTKGVGRRWRLDWHVERPLGKALFRGEPTEEDTRVLASALTGIAKQIGKGFSALQVALPDPLVYATVLPLPSVGGRNTVRDLVQWRLHGDLDRPAGALACTYQVHQKKATQRLVFGLAVDARWIGVIEDGFTQVGLSVSVLDAAASYAMSRVDLDQPSTFGLLVVDAEFWSFRIIRQGVPYVIGSGWRREQTQRSPIVQEVMRGVVAHAHEREGSTLNTLVVIAADGDFEDLRREIVASLPVVVERGMKTMNAASGVAPVALAACFPR